MYFYPGACAGIRKRGGPISESLFFFFLLFNFSGGGPAQKLAEKMTFSTKNGHAPVIYIEILKKLTF